MFSLRVSSRIKSSALKSNFRPEAQGLHLPTASSIHQSSPSSRVGHCTKAFLSPRSTATQQSNPSSCCLHATSRPYPLPSIRAASCRSRRKLIITMVEGHGCHRVAHAHRRLLIGHTFETSSPNGRFTDGADAIRGKPLSRIEVHGKNLFYFFGPPEQCTSIGMGPRAAEGPSGDALAPDVVVVHIHFGMAGAFRTLSLPGPEPTPTTRLRLTNAKVGVCAHLSAMTVGHGGAGLYLKKAAALGPDPLREDADKETLWASIQRSKKPIGLVLMDQALVAGIGNIYRAEILFKSSVHPELPAHTLSREAFERIWYHSVSLLQRGFVSGSILTVDPAEALVLGRPWNRRYIYNQRQCGRCKSGVRSWDMAGRTVYACETCQPLKASANALPPARAAALAAAGPPKIFRSHCAPDEEEGTTADKMTVAQLKVALTELNLDTRGTKAVLAARLGQAEGWLKHAAAKAGDAAAGGSSQAGTTPSGTSSPTRTSSQMLPALPDILPGLGDIEPDMGGGSDIEEDESPTQKAELLAAGSSSPDATAVLPAMRVDAAPQTVPRVRCGAKGSAPMQLEGMDGPGVGAGVGSGSSPTLTSATGTAILGSTTTAGAPATSSSSSRKKSQGRAGRSSGIAMQTGVVADSDASRQNGLDVKDGDVRMEDGRDSVDVAEALQRQRFPSIPLASELATAQAEAGSVLPLGTLVTVTVTELKSKLRLLGLPTSGNKPALLARLQAASTAAAAVDVEPANRGSFAVPAAAPGMVVPGTKALEGLVASAQDAVMEKMQAGEGRHVEHTAEGNDASQRLIGSMAASGRAKKRQRA